MINFTSLISGSSGNASYISDGKTHILVDCGMSGKQLAQALATIGASPEQLSALLITHEHSDHIKGAGVVARRYGLPIYATSGTHSAMDIGSVKDEQIKIIDVDDDFEIGTIGVRAFDIPHDAANPVGYSFYIDQKKVSVATDIGHMHKSLVENIMKSNIVLLESNHDVDMLQFGPYPFSLKQRILSDTGHLSNENAAQTALQLVNSGTEHIMLGHLSKENNHPEIALMETYNTLTFAGVNVGGDVTLQVADRYKATRFET
ncbi:MAG: MBL fold metallo-hydrolase [Oscillospiraceae bacterium]|nr:MBL fold metallo-hydrolase [Oscillospiraceae bacterium]